MLLFSIGPHGLGLIPVVEVSPVVFPFKLSPEASPGASLVELVELVELEVLEDLEELEVLEDDGLDEVEELVVDVLVEAGHVGTVIFHKHSVDCPPSQ